MDFFTNFDFYAYLILPLLIFCARVFDQSLGIVRIILATKGKTLPAFIFGFFESFVWLLAIGQIMTKIDNLFYYFVFAGGFASGNVFGIFIEKKLSIGFVVIRVIFQQDSETSINKLKENGFRLTQVDAVSMDRPVKMIFSTLRRNQVKSFLDLLLHHNPTAFYTIEDVKQVKEGYLIEKKRSLNPF
jgi:uncharacterized protein YebE (UPF0316 family)